MILRNALFLAVALAGLVSSARSAEVLAKRFDAPFNGNLFAGNTHDGRGGDGTDIARSWAPGFRTASVGAYAFVTGWMDQRDSINDGFITRVDAAGSIAWTKRMRDIFGFRMRINDVEVDSSKLYVCGQDQNDRAFVASLTHEGTALDYSLVVGTDARATSLALTTINGKSILTVGGDASGAGLSIKQRQRTAASDVFTDLKLFQSKRDNFVVQFDTNLTATWGTTLGFPWGDDFVTAVTADPNGVVFLASVFNKNVDANPSYYREFDNQDGSIERKVYSGSSSGNWDQNDGAHTDTYPNIDFYDGNFAILWRISAQNGLTARITHYMSVNNIFSAREQGSEGRITDISYQNGAIYAAGEWRKYLRPGSKLENGPGKFLLESAKSGTTYTWDIWTARLNASTLDATAWRIFRSGGEDFATQLTAAPDGIYLAGVAGGAMETFKNYITTNDGVLNPADASASLTQLGGSSKQHLFWQKLGETDLAPRWHLKPEEEGSAAVIPNYQKFAGITQTDGKVIITGGWVQSTLSLGPSDKRVNLPDGDGGWRGFAGFLKPDATWLEQVSVTINSAYGTPSPHKGTNTVAGGVTITASVPPEIYEAEGGVILAPQDTEALRTRAVTRRVCTGYQFRNSTTNGTTNTVTFVASGDTELTFLWRTEHAVEIESDLSTTEGLSSTAAGNPEPAVQKHWIRENEQFTAFIDGAELDSATPGVRWRSTGFLASGCVARAENVNDGSFVNWPAYQDRQQTKKITVGSPGRISWLWTKENSLRVAVNSSVAEGAPQVDAPPRLVFASSVAGFPENTILHAAAAVNDGTGAKYLNFTKENSGVILGYVGGLQANVLMLMTAEDVPDRDPTSVRIEGRNNGGAWTTLANSIAIPSVGRNVTQYFNFTNNKSYNEYRITVPTIANAANANSMQVAELRLGTNRYTGTGEFWFGTGTAITASAPASVSSGISSLALKGYTGGQGSVAPFDARNVTSKSFVLNAPSTITWDYARALYPETVTIGSAISFGGVTGVDATNVNKLKKPAGGSVSQGPSDSAWGDMQQWDEVEKKLYVLRPGKFTVEFENSAKPEDPAQNVIVEVTAQWPTQPNYTHVLEAPPVDLDPSGADDMAFHRVAYTEGGGTVSGSKFSATEPGRTVLLFSKRSGGVSTGNLKQESLVARVVNSLNWPTSALNAGAFNVTKPIGEAITSTEHDAAVGHNGYVLTPRAPVNAQVYNVSTLQGPIIPINETSGTMSAWALPNDTATTRVLAGRIVEFTSPDELWLDPATVKVAVSLNGDTNRTVNGVEFKTDGTGATANPVTANGVTVTNSTPYKVDNFASAPAFTGGTTGSAASLAEIMRDKRWAYATDPVSVITISGLQARQLYHIQLLTNEGGGNNRVFDISANDTLVVDNYTSSGHSAGRRWSANNSYAYTLEVAARDNGQIQISLAKNLGGNPAPVPDHGPMLNAVVVHSASRVAEDDGSSQLAVAWYKLQDGIRWPWKAARYVPQWPTSPNRIVVASRLGSEGLKAPGGAIQPLLTGSTYSDPVIYHQADPTTMGYNPNEEHALIAPSFLDGNRVAAFALHSDYNRQALNASFTSKPYTLVQYVDKSDPAKPVPKMLVYAVSEEDAATTDSRLPAFNQKYTYLYQGEAGQRLVPPHPLDTVIGPSATPSETNGENMAGRLAYHEDKKNMPWIISGDTDVAEDIRAALYYPMRADFWHPTAEVGMAVPLGQLTTARPRNIWYNTIWPADAAVLKAGETLTFPGGEYASDKGASAAALVPVLRPSDPITGFATSGSGSPAGEDATKAIDGNTGTKYLNFGKAGSGLQAIPVFGNSRVLEIHLTSAGDAAERDPASYRLLGSTSAAPDANTTWTLIAEGPVSFAARNETRTIRITNASSYRSYQISFPTLANAATANSMQIAEVQLLAVDPSQTGASNVSVKGLPGAAAWQSAKLLFDSANPGMAGNIMGSNYLARVFPALEPHEAPLALTSLPDDLKPASGNIIVEGLQWYFKKLPASLQKRVYYDSSSQVLAVEGLLNGRMLGDGDLLASPGAQTILQPNVLTAADEALLLGLSTSSAWTTAATSLAALSRNPNNANVTGSLGIGLEPDGAAAKSATGFGPGLAVVTNPDLLDPNTAATLPEGYVTIAENDDASLGDSPVAMHVMKISRTKYRGSLAVLAPENVFDEKITIRHTADFGGDVADLFFEWIYREEDGRDLNPPGVNLPTAGTPSGSDWTVFAGGGLGKSEIQMAGTGPTLITDNLFFCRYRHKDSATGWSAWAGAANSREPNPSSPSATIDAAYVAQLAPGWVKRVVAAVNLFDARYSDFRNNAAPATYTSAIQQAGPRWEGPVAFNPQKDAVENVGLIELYQTVLDRAKDFTINVSSGTDGVNTALLNAANRIAGLYTLMGNEAYADALDPTIGYSTQSGQFGNLAPSLHAFQNQSANLLDEELALLRGRGEVGARPAYNRLMWNFTNGPGEAAYVMNYGITDLTKDGFLDDKDARRLYPQGHGDAWGHYSMALRGYYGLLTLNNFTWSPRSEKYNIDGVVLDIDYLDERAFARTAAAKAQAGAELVDLVYRQAYTENPNGQWQGYQDTNTDRAWGVFETAQRCGTAALCDWLTANAILPGSDTTKSGIRRVDRTTVGELRLIAQQAANIQAKLDSADRGLNPQGLDPNVVPFDIDPVLTDRNNPRAATHFEQVYDRAVTASQNALRVFQHANETSQVLRRTADSTEKLRQQTIDHDRALRNQLIEIFGTPYEGQIGSGKAYPAGYNGPDLYLYMYVDQTSAGDDGTGKELLKPLDDQLLKVSITPGLRGLALDNNAAMDGGVPVADALKDMVSKYFPEDVVRPETRETITINLPRLASSYGFVAPDGWGERRSPGAIQAAIQELVQAEWKMRMAVDAYEGTKDDFITLLRKFEIKSGISAEKIRINKETLDGARHWNDVATVAFSGATILDHSREVVGLVTDGIVEAFPKTVGLATDATSAARGLVKAVHAVADGILRAFIAAGEITEYRANIEKEELQLEMDQKFLSLDAQSELVDILAEIQQLTNDEVDLRVAVIDAMESVRLAGYRVSSTLEKGMALIEERTTFNQRVASTTTQQRYEDFTFRVTRNEALSKLRSAFDLAARHAYLAGKAYQYELNLPDNHAANATPLLAEMLRCRTLGSWENGQPVLANGGLGESLAILKTNFDSMKGQLGFNNPATEVNAFSLRNELFRIGLSSRVNNTWRSKLEEFRVPDLWNYQYQNNGVNYGHVFRRYCRPFAPESAGPQPGLVIPFPSHIAAGKNWFGQGLAGGDSAFNASNFSTKIRAAGVRFDGYNNLVMSHTPQVYLVPVGFDRMFLPHSPSLADRSWNVVDQRIPAPLSISASNLNDPNWMPFTGSANGFFEEIRRFSAFRAYHDAGGWANGDMLSTGRLVGRSVWNTQWVLIIPSAAILSEPADADAGLDTFIYGAPLPGYTAATAGTANRDMAGVRDIRLLLQTYSVSGN